LIKEGDSQGGGFEGSQNLVLQFLHDHGTIPLPPYIADDASKYDDYQPIVAKQEGSVAAPTAALHFTDRLLQQLDVK
jgi:S-adenosylmethionine:tRNA ribosyltransferase-isomerase